MLTGIFDRESFLVLTVCSLSPGGRFSRKELKDATRLNNVPLDTALTVLVNSGVLKRDRKYFCINLEKAGEVVGLIQREYKALKQIPLDAYFCIVSLSFQLCRHKGIEAYLYGSYATLVIKEESAIDIAVITDSRSRKDTDAIGRAAEKISEQYGIKICLHYFGKEFHRDRKSATVAEILKNGVKLI